MTRRRIETARVRGMLATGEELMDAAGLPGATIVGVVDLVMRGVKLLEALGRVELVEAHATDSHTAEVS